MTEFTAPDLSDVPTNELPILLIACGMSGSLDPSDKAFMKAVRDELAKRKPVKKELLNEQ